MTAERDDEKFAQLADAIGPYLELLAIDASTGFRAFRLVAVRQQKEGLPRRLEAVHVLPCG